MNKIALLPLLVVMLACSTANQTSKPKPPKTSFTKTDSLTTMSLKLTSMSHRQDTWNAGEYNITLAVDFAKNSYTGVSGCNNYFGSIERTSNSTFKINIAGVTEMMCNQDIMQWEARYLNALTEHEFTVYEADNKVKLKNQVNMLTLTFVKE